MPKNSSEYPTFWADSLEKLKAFQVEVGAPGSALCASLRLSLAVCQTYPLCTAAVHSLLWPCQYRRVPHPPTHPPALQPCTQVAATVTGANRQWAVYDESFSDWNLNGTDALPKGSMIFVWCVLSCTPFQLHA